MPKPLIRNNGVGTVFSMVAGQTSLIYLKGKGLDGNTNVSTDNPNFVITSKRPKASGILVVGLQYNPTTGSKDGTGEADVTITVANPASGSNPAYIEDTIVTVYVDDGT